MKSLRFLPLLALLAITTSASAEGAKRLTLPNGLRVVVKSNWATEIVAIDLLLDVSALDEQPDRNGIRTLLQRLLLRGTYSQSGESMGRRLAEVGGLIDVSVGLDYVEIYALVPADGFETALSLLAEAIQRPAFLSEEVARQKAAAQQAAKTAAQEPFQQTYLAFRSTLYHDHPYGGPTLGAPSPLGQVTRDELVSFHARHYRPNRAVLAVCGAVGQARILRAVRNAFEGWLPGEQVSRQPQTVAPLRCSELVVRELAVDRVHLILGFAAPGVGQPGYFALQVLDSILSGGSQARLPRAVREQLGLAYDVTSFYPTLAGESHIGVYAATQPYHLHTVKDEIIRLLTAFIRDPVSPEELIRAKRYLLGSYALSHQRMKDQAYALAWYEILGIGIEFEERYADSVHAVTATQVQQAAQTVLGRFVLALTMPAV
jgi:predicted Zn-dependent peptidase